MLADEKKSYTVYHQAGFETTVQGHDRYLTMLRRPEWSDEAFAHPRPLTAGSMAQPRTMAGEGFKGDAEVSELRHQLAEERKRNADQEARLRRLEAAQQTQNPEVGVLPTPTAPDAADATSVAAELSPSLQARGSASITSRKK